MRIAQWLLIAGLALSLCGCAAIEKDRRRLTRAFATTIPDDPVPRAMTAPIWIPVGAVALVVDTVVLNPVWNAPAAVDDAMWAWTGFGVIAPAEIVLIIPRAVATPVLFLGSEIVRCSVPYVP